jgi:hypothetical protein
VVLASPIGGPRRKDEENPRGGAERIRTAVFCVANLLGVSFSARSGLDTSAGFVCCGREMALDVVENARIDALS